MKILYRTFVMLRVVEPFEPFLFSIDAEDIFQAIEIVQTAEEPDEIVVP